MDTTESGIQIYQSLVNTIMNHTESRSYIHLLKPEVNESKGRRREESLFYISSTPSKTVKNTTYTPLKSVEIENRRDPVFVTEMIFTRILMLYPITLFSQDDAEGHSIDMSILDACTRKLIIADLISIMVEECTSSRYLKYGDKIDSYIPADEDESIFYITKANHPDHLNVFFMHLGNSGAFEKSSMAIITPDLTVHLKELDLDTLYTYRWLQTIAALQEFCNYG